MDKYKSKSITLRTSTHSLLSDLSKVIVPGFDLSIPNTIDLIVREKINGSMGAKTKGTIDDTEKIQKA